MPPRFNIDGLTILEDQVSRTVSNATNEATVYLTAVTIGLTALKIGQATLELASQARNT